MSTDIKRIVVGYDHSQGSRRAADWAFAVADRFGAEVILLAAAPPSSVQFGELAREMDAHRQREGGSGDGAEADADADGLAPTHVVGGDPREVLAASPLSHDADLLVVGREGYGSGPGLFHLGSVAEYLAHHTTVPLVVVPPDGVPPFDRIVLGVDGSPASRAATRWCAGLASATGAGVTAVSVHEPFLEWTPVADPAAWHRETERRILDDLASELCTAGVDVTPVAIRGRRPTEGMLDMAGQADLLVLGLSPIDRRARLRAGGVAFGALHDAGCAVALVPGRA